MKKGVLIGCGVLLLLILCCCATAGVIYTTSAFVQLGDYIDDSDQEELQDLYNEFGQLLEENYEEESDQATEEFSEEIENDQDPNTLNEEDLSYIEGSLGFPGEFIPPLEVCAVNIKNGDTYCTRDMLNNSKYTYSQGYIIEVPKGTYNVYSSQVIEGDTIDYKAYYSDFVECGLEVSCPSHSPIDITLEPGEGIEGVDPIDWYVTE